MWFQIWSCRDSSKRAMSMQISVKSLDLNVVICIYRLVVRSCVKSFQCHLLRKALFLTSCTTRLTARFKACISLKKAWFEVTNRGLNPFSVSWNRDDLIEIAPLNAHMVVYGPWGLFHICYRLYASTLSFHSTLRKCFSVFHSWLNPHPGTRLNVNSFQFGVSIWFIVIWTSLGENDDN